MTFKSSYIFLDSSRKQEEPKEKDSLVFKKSIGQYLVGLFGAVKTKDKLGLFVKVRYECTIQDCEVFFLVSNVEHNTYLDICVEGKTTKRAIDCLEHIQKTFDKAQISSDYVMIISYCSISEYYCNKIYPKLNAVERNLRKLLFNIYIINLGDSYFKETISEDIQNDVKKKIGSKNNSKRLQEFFYSLDFGQVQTILFHPTWTPYDAKEIEAFLQAHKDLSSLTDNELRTKIQTMRPRSDWERFFCEKADTKLVQHHIKEVQISRNKVAHSKLFYKEEYKHCTKIIRELNKEINNAIDITENNDFVEKNEKVLENSLASIKNSINALYNSLVKPATEWIDFLNKSSLIKAAMAVEELAIQTSAPVGESSLICQQLIGSIYDEEIRKASVEAKLAAEMATSAEAELAAKMPTHIDEIYAMGQQITVSIPSAEIEAANAATQELLDAMMPAVFDETSE